MPAQSPASSVGFPLPLALALLLWTALLSPLSCGAAPLEDPQRIYANPALAEAVAEYEQRMYRNNIRSVEAELDDDMDLQSQPMPLPMALPLVGQSVGYPPDKRVGSNYMSLCLFKICNMGRKRTMIRS